MMKWMLQNRFMSPFALPGYIGICSIIFSVIFFFVTNEGTLVLGDSDYIINTIVFIVFSMGYNLFIFLIIDYFGPTHRVVMELFATFIFTIINLGKYNSVGVDLDKSNQIKFGEGLFVFIGHIVILFGVMGFNEIIVLGCFGLDYNTRVTINDRLLDSEENVVQMSNVLNKLNEVKNEENEQNTNEETEIDKVT
jgi:hypothetical protein